MDTVGLGASWHRPGKGMDRRANPSRTAGSIPTPEGLKIRSPGCEATPGHGPKKFPPTLKGLNRLWCAGLWITTRIPCTDEASASESPEDGTDADSEGRKSVESRRPFGGRVQLVQALRG